MAIPTTLVDKWRLRLAKGELAHKKWRETFRLDDLDRYWEGDQRPDWWQETFFVPINLIFANIQRQMDNLTSTTPHFNVRPARTFMPVPDMLAQLDNQAKVRESLLNAMVRSQDLKREFKKSLLDAYIAVGVMKVYYEPYLKPNPRFGQTIPGTITKEPEYRLFGENFRAVRRNPLDMRLDPYADSMENITWVAERIECTLDEVKENPLYKNTSDLKPHQVRYDEKQAEEQRKRGEGMATPMVGGNSSLAGTSLNEDRQDLVVLWEIYDVEEKRIITIAEGYDQELRDDPLPPGIRDHSYVFLWFIDRRNTPYPVPEVWNQVGPQDEYNVTRNQTMLHRRRFNRKYEVREGAFDDTELAKLEEPYDGLIVKKKGDGPGVTAIEDAALDPAVYFDTSQLRADFQNVAGEPVQDTEIAKVEKAAVANLLASAQEGRVRGKLSVMQDFFSKLACKMMYLYEAEMTLPMAVTVTGADGHAWEIVSPSQVRGNTDFYYEVALDSLIPQTPETERAAWMAFLQFMAMNPTIGAQPDLAKKTAKMFGVTDQTLVAAIIQAAQAAMQQQLLTGGSAGKPGMSAESEQAMAGGR